uniref:Putative hydroxypyruvate isomerase n=1 Tax=Sphenodon punctatus TaxID=8508 RepID=A0A8D0GL29_SPHPU
MAPLRFAANVAWLFAAEEPGLAGRLEAAGRAGFRAAELGWDWLGQEAAALRGVGLETVLINTPPGDLDQGDKGLGAVPGRQPEFREGLALAVNYAKALACPRIHLMAGRIPPRAERAAVATTMEDTFIENLRYAADLLDMVGLLEPINSRITDPRPSLWLHTSRRPVPVATQPSLRLPPLLGHIQIAQVPGRHEPDSPGEVNFPYLFQLLETLGYDGYVGCEYKPQGDTLEGLGWLRSYWQSRGLQAGGS